MENFQIFLYLFFAPGNTTVGDEEWNSSVEAFRSSTNPGLGAKASTGSFARSLQFFNPCTQLLREVCTDTEERITDLSKHQNGSHFQERQTCIW